MKIKILNETPERTIAAVFDPGEEVSAGLLQIANDLNLTAARLTGIGALSRVILGYFDIEKKEYLETEIDEQVEVVSLIGNFALKGEDKKVHAHIVVAKSDGTAHGGHLLHGWVRPTLEIVIVESPNFLSRKIDAETGLPLIELS